MDESSDSWRWPCGPVADRLPCLLRSLLPASGLRRPGLRLLPAAAAVLRRRRTIQSRLNRAARPAGVGRPDAPLTVAVSFDLCKGRAAGVSRPIESIEPAHAGRSSAKSPSACGPFPLPYNQSCRRSPPSGVRLPREPHARLVPQRLAGRQDGRPGHVHHPLVLPADLPAQDVHRSTSSIPSCRCRSSRATAASIAST